RFRPGDAFPWARTYGRNCRRTRVVRRVHAADHDDLSVGAGARRRHPGDEAMMTAGVAARARICAVSIALAALAATACRSPDASPMRTSGAPVLHDTVVRVDARRVRKLVRELLREASSFRVPTEGHVGRDPAARPRLDALGALRGAIAQDADAMERLAVRAGV